jgi:hypothetical protein
MKRLFLASSLAIVTLLSFQILSYAQCGDDPIDPAIDVAFEEEVEAIDSPDVIYLAFINGDTPKPNECGLNPSNDLAQCTGWGGPLNHDNMSIGEGGGTRNLITIGKVRYHRGLGTHSPATIIYDLTGKSYKAFHAVVGLDAEKTPGGCGHGGSAEFIFSIDGEEVYKSELLTGDGCLETGGEVVDFDIPSGAKELEITITEGGDGNGCDHADLGDARLMTGGFFAVEAAEKLSTTWGILKSKF